MNAHNSPTMEPLKYRNISYQESGPLEFVVQHIHFIIHLLRVHYIFDRV